MGKILRTSLAIVILLWSFDLSLAAPKAPRSIISSGPGITSLSMSDNGHILAIARGDKGVSFYKPTTAKLIKHWNLMDGPALGVAFLPGAKNIIVNRGNRITLFKYPSQKIVRNFILKGSLTHLTASPDGKVIAAAGSVVSKTNQTIPAILAWDTDTGDKRWAFAIRGEEIKGLVFSADGTKLGLAARLGGDKRALLVYDPTTGKRQLRIDLVMRGDIDSIVFSPDGKTLTISSNIDNWIRFYDLKTRTLLKSINNTGTDGQNGLFYLTNGQTLVSIAAQPRQATVWDLNTGGLSRSLSASSSPVVGGAMSSSGLLAVAADKIYVWELIKPEPKPSKAKFKTNPVVEEEIIEATPVKPTLLIESTPEPKPVPAQKPKPKPKPKKTDPMAEVRKGAKAGNANDQAMLGLAYRRGFPIPRDYQLAAKWIKASANQANFFGQANLALMYHIGLGVDKDASKAEDLAIQSAPDILVQAEAGRPEMMCFLGWMYTVGLGLDKDLKQAAIWFAKAAEAKDPVAMTNLAVMYLKGLGVDRDHETGAQWMLLAAKSGYSRAQYLLSRLYAQGVGLAKDDKLANTWLTNAKKQGFIPAKVAIQELPNDATSSTPTEANPSKQSSKVKED